MGTKHGGWGAWGDTTRVSQPWNIVPVTRDLLDIESSKVGDLLDLV